MRTDESADEAALRLVREKLGVQLAQFHTEQLGTFTAVDRVPGERSLALTYMVYLPVKPELVPGYGARDVKWFAITPRVDRDDLVADGLAFAGVPDSQTEREFYQRIAKQLLTADHGLILRNALQRVRNRLDYAPTILLVLGEQFTLKQARQLYAICGGSQWQLSTIQTFVKPTFIYLQRWGQPDLALLDAPLRYTG